MALSQPYTGTALSVNTTEISLVSGTSTLQTVTTAGIYQLFLDVSALTATESYSLKIYETARAGGTKRIVQEITLTGVQAEPIYVTPALQLVNGFDFTLVKLQGTTRTFDYSVRMVA